MPDDVPAGVNNPYQSPPELPAQVEAQPAESPAEMRARFQARIDRRERPAVAVAETIGARYLAAFIDNVFAVIFMLVLAKSISDRYPAVQAMTFVTAYFLYFFLLEAITGRTIGKLFLGLVVIGFDGRRITWRQALVRTLWRLIEVNPVLFGALPAGIIAWLSPHHQRLGDVTAGTVVVRNWRWRRFVKQAAEAPPAADV